jgi:hypothetical protein
MLAAMQRDAATNIGFVRAHAVCGLLWLPVYLRNPGLIALLPFKRSPSVR